MVGTRLLSQLSGAVPDMVTIAPPAVEMRMEEEEVQTLDGLGQVC